MSQELGELFNTDEDAVTVLRRVFKHEAENGFKLLKGASYGYLTDKLWYTYGVVRLKHYEDGCLSTISSKGVDLHQVSREESYQYLESVGLTRVAFLESIALGGVIFYYRGDYELMAIVNSSSKLKETYLPTEDSSCNPLEDSEFNWEVEYKRAFPLSVRVLQHLKEFSEMYLDLDKTPSSAVAVALVTSFPLSYGLASLLSNFSVLERIFGFGALYLFSFIFFSWFTLLIGCYLRELKVDPPIDINTVEGRLSLIIGITENSTKKVCKSILENEDLQSEAKKLAYDLNREGYSTDTVEEKRVELRNTELQLHSFKYKLCLLKSKLEDHLYEVTAHKREQEAKERRRVTQNQLNTRLTKLLGDSDAHILSTEEEESEVVHKLQVGLEEVNEQAAWLGYYNQSLLELGV